MKHLILVAAFFLSACGRPSTSHTDNVFGPDNREIAPDSGIYRAVGRLDSGCTGSLVARNIVLTAAHCVLDAPTQTVKPTVKYFRPNLRNGASAKASWVNFLWIGSKDPENDRLNDWAFLRVDDDLGSQFGTLPLHSLDFATGQLPYTVSLIGYSSDKNQAKDPYVHRGCYVMKVVDGKLYHDCDATAGISGAPMLAQINGNQYVVGLAVSEFRQGAANSVRRDQFSDDYANVAIPAKPLYDLSTQLIGAVNGGQRLPSFDQTLEMVNPNSRAGGDQPGQPSQPGHPSHPDQPGLTADQLVSADVILQRAQTLDRKLSNLQGAVRMFRDLSYRVGYRDVVVQSPRVLGDIDRFGSVLVAIVNGAYRGSDHAVPLCEAYLALNTDADFYQSLDSGLVSGPYVQDFERIRGDIQQMVADLRVLIVP